MDFAGRLLIMATVFSPQRHGGTRILEKGANENDTVSVSYEIR